MIFNYFCAVLVLIVYFCFINAFKMSFHHVEEDGTDKDTGMLLNLSQKSNIYVGKLKDLCK